MFPGQYPGSSTFPGREMRRLGEKKGRGWRERKKGKEREGKSGTGRHCPNKNYPLHR